jgi:hypothetical protein
MDRWERKLATRDTNRVVRPFEWGTDWLNSLNSPLPGRRQRELRGMRFPLRQRNAGGLRPFFSYKPVRDYRLEENRLTFTSPVHTRYPENNTAHALWFPVPDDKGRVVIVLPQWNSGPDDHVGLAKLLNRCGISALRMTMAYHAERKPAETQRADYHVSSNVGRTIHAGRQSAVDVRACVDWLAAREYSRIGVLGTSLGSCVAFMAAAHDARIRMGIFNHVSMHFADVVWTGLSTQNVSKAFTGHVTQEELRRYWSVISPASYLKRFQKRDLKTLLIWASHDSTFLPVYSRQVLDSFRELDLPHKVFNLPCGHYTTGQFPFNLLDGLVMCRFAARNL